MEKALHIQKAVKEILEGNTVNLVGGSVRDIVLGNEPKDYDFNTPLDPETVEALVKKAGRRAYSTGKRFGTIGFKIPLSQYRTMLEDGSYSELQDSKINFEYVEVTTYRQESYDGNSRKPSVEFVDDLKEDLARRDLTINAMVLNDDGTIYDPFGGKLDILARQIKTVGLPKDRFNEDPLRMLRVARFASQLDFGVDPNAVGKIRHLGPSIYRVSKERWVTELDKLLMGKNPMRGIKVLMQSQLMTYVLPEVALVLQDDEAYQELASVLNDKTLDLSLNDRWAALVRFIGYPFTARQDSKGNVTFKHNEAVRKELLEGICERLRFSNERKEHLLSGRLNLSVKSIDKK